MKTGAILASGGLAGALLVIGCQPAPQPPKGETSAPPDKVVEITIPASPKEHALAAKEALFKKLSARLMEAMGNGGPAAAIDVCSREAPRIAERVGQEFGVKIGRTSFRLRNPQNAPPDWVKPLIEDRPTEARFVDLPEQHTGALLPIMLKVQCMACHGPKEQIGDDVQRQLAKLYPDDQAIGFQEGDLRGWFWVDVPGRASDTSSKATTDPKGNSAETK